MVTRMRLDSALSTQHSALRLNVGPAVYEPALERHLVRHPGQAVLGGGLRQPADLEEDLPGTDDRGPVLRLALALAHAGFRRDRGDRLVREDADVVPALARHEAGHRDA